MTSRGGSDCDDRGCNGGCGRRHHRKSREISTSVPTSSSAFTRSSSSSSHSYSKLRIHPHKKIRIYYFKAELLPQNCMCIGNTATCPFNPIPTFSTVPNPNLPSGYGKAKFKITYDPVSKLGFAEWRISYAKLYSFGNQTFNPVRGVEVRISPKCSTPGAIVINALAIYLLATAGETPDCYVTGNLTLPKERVQQFLHNLMYIVIRTLLFQNVPN